MRAAAHGLGELLVTLGVVALLLVVYELFVTGIFAASTQQTLHHQIVREWARPAAPATPGAAAAVSEVPLGDGVAVLRIPRFGPTYDPVIVQGAATADLERGPGHIPGTAMPGQVGNFVVSGHRTTWGHWFYNLNELRPGDPVVVETRTTWFIYRVEHTQIVAPTDVAVVAPVPGHPGQAPTQRLFTFTTCNPRYSAAQRMVVGGVLASSQPRSLGIPAVLGNGG